jgi:phosphoglucomutase
MLIDIPAVITAYYTGVPDPSITEQRISFGTSGHRGSSLRYSFNEAHILAITQAICLYRKQKGIDGPLFIGMDTHALSTPAQATALEVLAVNGVEVMVATGTGYTPTPAVSLAILQYNRGRTSGLADGIIITPSHNPPEDGGVKYNPPNGGPAEPVITQWIEKTANGFLESGTGSVTGPAEGKIQRISFEKAMKAPTTHRYDYLNAYVNDLGNVLDMEAIRNSTIRLGVDPLGGAGVHYWGPIAEKYGLKNLTVLNTTVDASFRFMTVDHDGKIRMDPSSPYAMKSLIDRRDQFDVAFACDTDHDRHGIVTRQAGLLPPNHYLCVAINHLFQNRPGWGEKAAVGKTVVSSLLIDRVTAHLGRQLREVPVGFKWFVDGLLEGSLGFVGEESAGAAFLRRDGKVWTTDKDGFIPALLSAEIMAKTGRDPGEIYHDLTTRLGEPVYDRIDADASAGQKKKLSGLSPEQIDQKELAGEPIKDMLTKAPGNGASIGGLKVTTGNGWFAARPSGTENIYKIYAESFLGREHLQRILEEAQSIVDKAIGK